MLNDANSSGPQYPRVGLFASVFKVETCGGYIPPVVGDPPGQSGDTDTWQGKQLALKRLKLEDAEAQPSV